VRHVALAALAAVHTVPITSEFPTPALQGGEPNAQQSDHFSGPSTGRHSSIEALKSLAAILRFGQPPSSSPQLAWIFLEAYCFAARGYSSAAASARALSLRRNSCYSRLIYR